MQIDAVRHVEHVGSVIVVGEVTAGELCHFPRHREPSPVFLVADAWAQLTCGSRLPVTVEQ